MPTVQLIANTAAPFSMAIDARSHGSGYRVLSYSGSLGGGTLQLFTQVDGGDIVPVPDGKLSAAMLDGNGDAIRQVVFVSAGNVFLQLTGATGPNCKVSVA